MKSTLQTEFALHLPKKNIPYFEGWYTRVHTDSKDFAIIFGLSTHQEKKEAFIQYLDTRQSKVYSFSWDSFTYTSHPFQIKIDTNLLSLNYLRLQLPDIEIELYHENLTPLDTNWFSPTIMGPFSYLPMECIHSVISLHHHVVGYIKEGQNYHEIDGTGYMEKDRGTSFPSEYLWFQSNQNKESPCFFLSYAHIPFAFSSFQGCICVLMLEKQYRFATYLGCRVNINHKNKSIVLHQSPYELIISFDYPQGHTLTSPIQGVMSGRVNETLEAEANVTLKKKNILIGKWKFTHGGFENNGIF